MSILHDIHDFEADYYLAGPMTGIPDFNYPYFTAAARRLRECGFTIHSPHEVPWPQDHESMPKQDLWEHMMQATHEMLKKCNAIILLKGWSKSRGAKIELGYALERDWPVYFYLDPPGRPINMTRL